MGAYLLAGVNPQQIFTSPSSGCAAVLYASLTAQRMRSKRPARYDIRSCNRPSGTDRGLVVRREYVTRRRQSPKPVALGDPHIELCFS